MISGMKFVACCIVVQNVEDLQMFSCQTGQSSSAGKERGSALQLLNVSTQQRAEMWQEMRLDMFYF